LQRKNQEFFMSDPHTDRREVIQRELAWHEQESHRRYRLDALLYDSPAFDDIVRHSIDFLQGEPGELVLDMGCGEGKETLQLAMRGFHVVGTDLSLTQMARARELIHQELPQAKVTFIQANAEQLPFAGNSFRRIYGKAILHHLDLDGSSIETRRLLSSKGRAAFAEPMSRHFIIWLGRRMTPKFRTEDERPMEFDDLERFGEHFDQWQTQTYYLLAPLSYAVRLLPGGEGLFAAIHSRLAGLDQKLLTHFHSLRRFAWYGAVRVKIGEKDQ
jgi:ubiquinone/menaquinone biosynthesis C-methylase UbiE